jgi:hypothetical protein
MNLNFSAFVNQSAWRCLLAAVMTSLFPILSQASLILDVGSHPGVSAANPTITLFLQNNGGSALTISGGDIFFTIQSTGPTVSTSGIPSSSLDLLTGTVFGAAGGFSQNKGSPFGPQSQDWSLFNFSGFATIGANQTVEMGTLTFNSFPVGGPYSLSFSGTDFLDGTGNPIPSANVSLIDGTLNVVAVPEPSNALAAVFMALFASFQTLRLRRTKVGD